MAIIQFPLISPACKRRIPLYADEEIELATLAINAFGNLPHTITTSELKYADPQLAIDCMRMALHSKWFSDHVNNVFVRILGSVEYEK